MITLQSIDSATLEEHDDGTATLTVMYPGVALDSDARMRAANDMLAAVKELAPEFVIADRPDICGMGCDVCLTVPFRRAEPTTSPTVESVPVPPADPDPAA